jgi:hypothetical protein
MLELARCDDSIKLGPLALGSLVFSAARPLGHNERTAELFTRTATGNAADYEADSLPDVQRRTRLG